MSEREIETGQLQLGVPRTNEEDLATRVGGGERDAGGAWRDILGRNPMMRHLVEALERGKDIGHYGRLVFAMVAHHFASDEELVAILKRNPGFGIDEAEALCRQVRERDYNPPRPERIAEWQRAQDFPICPEGDARECNVYRDLRFPPQVYEHIQEFYEGRGMERGDRRE